MNISEEMCRSSLWKQFVKDGTTAKSRKGKPGDKSKHKHKHHHKNRHHRHKRDREGSADEEGLWMLEKKKENGEDAGSDVEMGRKLSTINEDKQDIVIDMEEIQKSLLELNEIGSSVAGEGDDKQTPGDVENPV